MQEQNKELHEFCNDCVKTRCALRDGPVSESTGAPLYNKGDFIVNCGGIPANDKYIPFQEKVIQKLQDQSGEEVSDEMIEEIKLNYDLVRWAKHYLDWDPRSSIDGLEYQALILNCSAKRKVLRCGRRLGKSEVLIVWALYKLFTHSPQASRWDAHTKKWEEGFSTIMFVAPYLSQVKDFFTRLRNFIEKNPELQAEIKTDVSTPFFKLELKSGMKILGFSAGSSGASSVRGQKADIIILDEMDYLEQEALDTIVALLMEHNDVELLAASTPSGRREYFYEFCVENMEYKEFFFPSMCNPSWGPRMEAELRNLYRTEIAWLHEIEAKFGESDASVFQYKYIMDATKKYPLMAEGPREGCLYSLGCDWNDSKNGTKIRIVEFDPSTSKLRAVDVSSVQKAGWTQTLAVSEVVRMNRKWRCDYVYVDAGHGAMQIEVLRKYGQDAQMRRDEWAHTDMTLIETKAINFSSKIEIFDPISGLPQKQSMKPYMVESVVRKFESNSIEISTEDEVLIKQLTGYHIARVAASGAPVYESGPSGDHDLDALMLGVLGFEIELSQFTNRKYSYSVAIAPAIGTTGNKNIELEEIIAQANGAEVPVYAPRSPARSLQSKPATSSYGFGSIREDRVYSPAAFNNDRKGSRPARSRFSRRIK